MIFQEALGEEDEYIRLQKISEGIKIVSKMLRNMQTISDPIILKSMICSYPFQQASIELLISAFFDYFRNRLFLQAFYQALQEISELQEYREFLGNRSCRNFKLNMNGNVNKIIEEQQKQGNIPFSKQVIEKLLIAKKFACSYFKRFFELAIELDANLELMSTIFKQFIIHTRCQKFQQQLIQQFQDCQNSIFYDYSWKHKYDLELDEFCSKWNVEITPKWVLERKQSMSSFNYIPTDKQIKTEQDEDYITPASKVESIADCVEIMQKIISKPIEMVNQHDLLQLHSSENIEILIKFIIHPLDEQLIDDWSLLYQKNENMDDQQNEQIKIYKEQKIEMDYYYTIRSFKSLQFLTQKINHSRFYQNLLEMIPKIFQTIKENYLNKQIQMNLNHFALLINQLIILCPKISINKIIELNFLFLLITHIDNSQIQGLIIDLIDINTDKYKLGLFILEQIWKYINETKFLNFIYLNLFNNNKNFISVDNDQIIKQQSQDVLKILSKFKDKAKTIEIMRMSSLDEFIGPLQLQQKDQNEENILYPENLSYTQLLEQDVDAIRAYLDERRTPLNKNYSRKQSTKMDLINSSFRSQTIQHIRTTSSTLPILPILATPKNTSNKLSDSMLSQESKMKRSSFEKLDKLEKITTNLKSQFGQQQLLTSRQSIQSDNGFSSSKLVMLYPSACIKAQPSQFEIDLQEFSYNDDNKFQETLNFLEQFIDIIYQYQIKRSKSENELCLILFNENLLLYLIKIFLLEIQNKNKTNIGIQCGRIVNIILQLAHKFALQEQKDKIMEIFYQIIEYLNKIIIIYYKQNQEQGLNNIISLTFLQTLNNGFTLFEPYDPTKTNKNIYKYMNESVIHLFVIQFFKTKQNSIYQYEFYLYIDNILKKAPAYLIQNVLFNLGFISSLYNAYTTFYVNGFKSHGFNESLFFYITRLVSLIYKNLISRDLNIIYSSLEPLDSWKCLIKSLPEFKLQKEKKQKTQETDIPKSSIDSLSIKHSPNNEQRQSLILNLNPKKLSLKQQTPSKLSARVSSSQFRSQNNQSSTSLIF